MPVLTHLQRLITESNIQIEKDMGSPSFTWQNTTYTFIPSVATFQRALEHGGYETVRLLTGTVRRLNMDGSAVFTTLPQPQQKMTYNIDSQVYRIETVKQDPTQSYIRITASNSFKGI